MSQDPTLTNKAYWYGSQDSVPTVFSAGQFLAAPGVSDFGGTELEVPAATLAGIWILGVTAAGATTGAIWWLRSRTTQLLVNNSATVTAGNQNKFGPTAAPASKVVARVGSFTSREGTSFATNVNNQGTTWLPYPLFVPGGNWVCAQEDVANTASAFDFFWIEVPLVGG